MTLFIVFIATANIAIGYAIAVMMGHGQWPWRTGRYPVARPSSPEDVLVDELETTDEEAPTIDAENTDDQQIGAVEQPVG